MLHHFNPERYIWSKTDASSYVIGKIFSQMTFDQ